VSPATDPLAEATDRALLLLEELCALSSPSGDREGLAQVSDRLAAELGRRGLPARVEAWEGEEGSWPVVLAGRGPVEGALLLAGHFDTVLAASPPRREQDRLVATGAIDMKGGLAALCGALDLLAAEGGALPGAIHLVAVPDEETGGPISHRAMRRFGATARALWVLEPGSPRPDGGESLVVGRRGLLHFSLRVEGQAAHAGADFWVGRSALIAAAAWAGRAAALSRTGRGPIVNPARLVAAEAGAVDHPERLAGLLGTPRQANVVPDRARLDGEARFFREADGREVARALQGLAAEVASAGGVRCDLELGEPVPALEPTPDRLAHGARAVAAAAARGWHLELEEDRGGISFPNFLPPGSVIPVLDGLGPVGGGMHTRDEHVRLESFRRRVRLLADLLAGESG
jgi:glutamate carboxypeptidase